MFTTLELIVNENKNYFESLLLVFLHIKRYRANINHAIQWPCRVTCILYFCYNLLIEKTLNILKRGNKNRFKWLHCRYEWTSSRIETISSQNNKYVVLTGKRFSNNEGRYLLPSYQYGLNNDNLAKEMKILKYVALAFLRRWRWQE